MLTKLLSIFSGHDLPFSKNTATAVLLVTVVTTAYLTGAELKFNSRRCFVSV